MNVLAVEFFYLWDACNLMYYIQKANIYSGSLNGMLHLCASLMFYTYADVELHGLLDQALLEQDPDILVQWFSMTIKRVL